MKSIHAIFMYVPYGCFKYKDDNDVTMLKFVSLEDEYEDITTVTSAFAENIRVMTLFVRNAWNKRLLGLEQRFEAKYIPQYTEHVNGFRYRHSENSIIITRLLGSVNPKIIDSQAKLLVKECRRYYTLYCKTT